MIGLALALAILLPVALPGSHGPWFRGVAHHTQTAFGSSGMGASRQIPTAPDVKGLQLAASVFAPAPLTYSGAVDTNAMDDPQNWPRLHHLLSYSALGLSGTYFESARWTPPGSAQTVAFDYAGSVFSREPGAYDSWQDGATFWPYKYNNLQYAACPDMGVPVCNRWELAGTNGITEWDDTIQLGQCLIETRTFAAAALFTAQQTQIVNTLAGIDRAAVDAARTVCTVPAPAASVAPSSPALGIDSLRVEKENARPDWTLGRPSVRKISRGQQLLLSIYYTIRNVPKGSIARFRVVVRAGGRVVADRRDSPYTLSPSIAQYRHFDAFTPTAPGRYTVTANVAVGGLSVSGVVAFTAG